MKVKFDDATGLVPAVIQDYQSGQVLMVGYMNQKALDKTEQEGIVTFYSRSKGRLWTKGETSGNFLKVKKILIDCDKDTLLIKAEPIGPVCHTGNATCFEEEFLPSHFLCHLDSVIRQRREEPSAESYTSSLFQKGLPRMAQKVGEEGVEVAISSLGDNKEEFLGEAADLLFHLMVLLRAKEVGLEDVIEVLKRRHR